MARAARKASGTDPEETDGQDGEARFTPKRGRPSASQVVAIDGAIIATARQMFLENGYANTSMEAVASSVGVSKGTVYSRYPNKSDLFKAIVTDRLAAWSLSATADAETKPDNISERMFRFGIEFLTGMRVPEVSAFDRLIMSEARRFPEVYRDFHDQGYLPFVDLLVADITALGNTSGWPLQDARSIATSFVAGLHGWYRMSSLLEEPTTEEVSAFVARLVAIFVGGRAAW